MNETEEYGSKRTLIGLPAFHRRGFLVSGTAGALGLHLCSTRAPAVVTAKNKVQAAACILAAEQTEGPFYLDHAAVRSDITEGKPGLPLRLRIAIVDARSCAPLANAAVDIWHCDAQGVYSGFANPGRSFPNHGGSRWPSPPPPPEQGGLFPGQHGGGPPPPFDHHPTNKLTFLRGLSVTDQDGVANFLTIYPGWYAGRAIHIHLKVRTSMRGSSRNSETHVCHTGQLFLPEDVSDEVMKSGAYGKHTGERLRQKEDGIFQSAHDPGTILSLARYDKRKIDGGFLAKTVVGVDPSAEPHVVGPGGGDGWGSSPFDDHA